MEIYKGKLKIGDKTYDCSVVNGVRYIDGKTIEEFLKTLDPEELLIMANIGRKQLNKKAGINTIKTND